MLTWLSNLFLKFHICKLSNILYDRNIKYMKHSQLLDVVIHTCYSIYLCSKRQ